MNKLSHFALPALPALLTLLVTSGSLAASFDCGKAASRNEKTICGDAQLSAMDDALGRVFRQARDMAPDKRAFRAASDAQWRWREQHCSDRACLLDWYRRRQAELSAAAGRGDIGDQDKAAVPVPLPQALRLGLDARQIDGLAPAGSMPWPHYTRVERGTYFYRDPDADASQQLVSVRYYGVEHGQTILEAVRGQTVLRYTCSSDCRYIAQLVLPGDVEKDSVILANDHHSLPSLIVGDALNGLLVPATVR